MITSQIFDPSKIDPLSSTRGGGRFIQLLRENLNSNTEFITTLENVQYDKTLIIPFFDPFSKPVLSKRIARKQTIVIYDVIPLKHKDQFPVGIRGKLNVFLNKQALKHYDCVVTISECSKKDLVRYLNVREDKIKVIYPTLSNVFKNSKLEIQNTNKNQASTNYQPPTKYCLYVGDVNWNKNIYTLAKAIKLADVPCVFVGKAFNTLTNHVGLPENVPPEYSYQDLTHPWQQEFKEFVKELGRNKNFIFYGYVTDKELVDTYQKATLNLLLSRDEGFGFSYLEASSLGIPSLLSKTPVFQEIAQDAALFADPNSPSDIAKQIKSVWHDEKKLSDLGSKAKQRSVVFNRSKFTAEWQSIIT